MANRLFPHCVPRDLGDREVNLGEAFAFAWDHVAMFQITLLFPWSVYALFCLRMFSTAFAKSGLSGFFVHSSQKSMVALSGFSAGG